MHTLTSIYEAPARPTVAATDASVVKLLGLVARAFAAVDETPARIEAIVHDLAPRFGYRAVCDATATSIVLTVARDDARWTEVIRVLSDGPDYARAVALHRLLARVVSRELSPDDAGERIEEILAWKSKTPAVWVIGASLLLSVAAGLLLNLPAMELGIAAALGTLVGASLLVVGKYERFEPLAPVALAALSSAVVFWLARGGRPMHPMALLIASLVIFLPGWRLTVAMSELSTGFWTSGSGRFLAAITTLLLLIVGVVAGQQLVANQAPVATQIVRGELPVWARLISPVLAGISMTVLFRARRQDMALIVVMCLLTSLVSTISAERLGTTAAAFVGAFTAMTVGSVLARVYRIPYRVLQQPPTVLLVPGSIGFLSMSSLVNRDVSDAVQTGFQMLFIAVTLALGGMTAQVMLQTTGRREYRV